MSDPGFYRAFEDKHRGSRALIKGRLQVYVPFLMPLLSLYPHGSAVDLGCGRGEWLELVSACGFAAYGVDTDDGMLASCHELGLHAENKDLIAALRDLPDESQTVVSAFHVVEHIPFETLMTLVREAFRVLKPAGLLILETPNPENISVGTANFYLDPTHERPIPPSLLSFLPEYTGFYRTKVVRLQEPESLREKTDVALMDVLGGVSPDYSVVAQKPGRQSELDLFNPEFEFEFGLNLGHLASRYDAWLATRFSAIESLSRSALGQANTAIEQAAHAEAQAAHANDRANHAEVQAVQANERANHAEAQAAQANEHANRAEAHAQIINQHYQAVVCSRSWKLTKPLRLAGKFARWFVRGSIAWLAFKPGSRPRRVIRSALIKAMAVVQARPGLERFALKVLYRFPRLKQRLWNMRIQHDPVSQPTTAPMTHTLEAELSPRAQKIYHDLKAAIEKHNKEGV